MEKSNSKESASLKWLKEHFVEEHRKGKKVEEIAKISGRGRSTIYKDMDEIVKYHNNLHPEDKVTRDDLLFTTKCMSEAIYTKKVKDEHKVENKSAEIRNYPKVNEKFENAKKGLKALRAEINDFISKYN